MSNEQNTRASAATVAETSEELLRKIYLGANSMSFESFKKNASTALKAAQQQAEPDGPAFWLSAVDADFLKSRMQISARVTALHKGGGKRVPVFFNAQSDQRAGVAEGDVLAGWVFEHRVDDGVCIVKSPSGLRFVTQPGMPVHELVIALITAPSAAAPTQQQEGRKE